MAEGDSPRPAEPSKIITAIWTTNDGETCTIKVGFAKQVYIYGATKNVFDTNLSNWETTVPPNHTCTVHGGEGVTFG